MANYLITGITGFVGSHMADLILKNDQNAEIYAIKRWRSRTENIIHLLKNNKIKFLEADLLDSKSLLDAINFSKPDYVLHFAAQSFPGASFKTPVTTLQTNIIGTTNLLETILACRKVINIDPLILSISSSEVYGNPLPEEVPISETNPIRAANPYSISKVGQDLISQYYFKAYGLKIIVTRMFSHEGARRGEEFALSNFAKQIVDHENKRQNNPPYPIYVGNLDSVRTYAHIDDAVRAYWECLKKCEVGEVYNIGGEYTTTVENALSHLKKKSKIDFSEFTVIVDPKKVRPTDITLQVPDCNKFKQKTGWQPEKTFDNICDDIIAYWRSKTN